MPGRITKQAPAFRWHERRGGTFRAAKDACSVLTKAGVPGYAELVCVSDDIGEAAVTYVVLKLMGYPDIKVLAR